VAQLRRSTRPALAREACAKIFLPDGQCALSRALVSPERCG
jgi:hypothetical protein